MVAEGGSVDVVSGSAAADRTGGPDPAPGTGETGGDDAPRTPAEEVLAAVWCEVLDRDDVGIHHNFFLLGGTSLLATRVVMMTEELLGQRVPVRTLFENATVALLAARVEERLTDADRDRLAALVAESAAPGEVAP